MFVAIFAIGQVRLMTHSLLLALGVTLNMVNAIFDLAENAFGIGKAAWVVMYP